MNIKEQNGVVKNKIVELVSKAGQMTPKQISYELELSQSMTQRHLKRLVDEGKLAKKGFAPRVLYVLPSNKISTYDLTDEEGQQVIDPNLDIYTIIKKVESTMKKYNVKKAELYGSFARREQTKKSDVDIMVDFVKPIDGWTFAGMVHELEDKLRRDVDLVSKNGMSPRILPYIKPDLTTIYVKE